jgi:hypothetical protein
VKGFATGWQLGFADRVLCERRNMARTEKPRWACRRTSVVVSVRRRGKSMRPCSVPRGENASGV